MGKGRRIRAERRVLSASVEADVESRAATGTTVAERRSAAVQLAAGVAVGPGAWSTLDRRNDGLVRLEELVAMRDEARGAVVRLEEEVGVVVAHLRVDEVSWAQIGRVLGVTRQGARQRYGVPNGSHRTDRVPRRPRSLDG